MKRTIGRWETVEGTTIAHLRAVNKLFEELKAQKRDIGDIKVIDVEVFYDHRKPDECAWIYRVDITPPATEPE